MTLRWSGHSRRSAIRMDIVDPMSLSAVEEIAIQFMAAAIAGNNRSSNNLSCIDIRYWSAV